MSILPELIIQQTLVKGFRTFRENMHLVDMLFRNLTQEELQPIREFIRDSAIDISLNYPDQGLSLPAIVILLKSEVEEEALLGEVQQSFEDLQRMESVTPFTAPELLGDQTVLGAGSVNNVGYIEKTMVLPTTALGGATDEIWAPLDMTNLIDPFEEADLYVVVMEGTGAGQRNKVVTIIPDTVKARVTIDVEDNWSIVPDATSIFSIVRLADQEGITGQPSKIYTSTDKIERLGQINKTIYQLEINGPNQDATIFLYNITKAIMLVSRRYLARQGVINGMRMSGMDLAPAQEYFPTLAYRRALTLEFSSSFDIYTELTEPIATAIEIGLTVHQPDISDSTDVEVEVSNTQFNVT